MALTKTYSTNRLYICNIYTAMGLPKSNKSKYNNTKTGNKKPVRIVLKKITAKELASNRIASYGYLI